MTIYCLEMRNTENWSDVRYRAYTKSEKKMHRFEILVTKIQFTDSGHGLVPHVSKGRTGPKINIVADHVDGCLK